MFDNAFMQTPKPLSFTNEINCWENRPFTSAWPETDSQKKNKDNLVTKVTKKKNKRNRTAYTTEQLRVLEKIYTKSKYIDTERRKSIAKNLGIGEKCIKVWFQNRRMKEKRESSESSCDSSSERCVTEPITPPPLNNQSLAEEFNIPLQTGPQNDTDTQTYTFPFEYKEKPCEYSARQLYNNFLSQECDNNNVRSSEYFQYDRNVYPTQYYPNTTNSFNETANNNYYYQFDNNCYNNWFGDVYSNYFQ